MHRTQLYSQIRPTKIEKNNFLIIGKILSKSVCMRKWTVIAMKIEKLVLQDIRGFILLIVGFEKFPS